VRRVRFGLLLGLGLGLVFMLAVAAHAAYLEIRSDFRPPRGRVAKPSDPELATLRDVVLAARGTAVRGWYQPSTNGAAVVLLHGTGEDRSQLVPEARILARAGYGVLLFDWPGHGESGGVTRWDGGERDALRAALDYLGQQRDVDPQRVGAYGFSMGSLIATQVAATDRRIAALVLAGSFADPDAPLAHQFRHWGILSEWPAIWAAHFEGMHLDGQRPRDLIAAFAPRPLLLVGGTRDDVVPPVNARALMDAAHEPKSLWIVEGAHHGDYVEVAGAEYATRLVAFFDRGLSARGPAP
jgi:alpha-beta hydrolase superfamily lysophospholipase